MKYLAFLAFFAATLMICQGAPKDDGQTTTSSGEETTEDPAEETTSEAPAPDTCAFTVGQLNCLSDAVVNDFESLTSTVLACQPSVLEDPLGCLGQIEEIQNCFQ